MSTDRHRCHRRKHRNPEIQLLHRTLFGLANQFFDESLVGTVYRIARVSIRYDAILWLFALQVCAVGLVPPECCRRVSVSF